jgi:archaellum component FlaF (FlaF/FlaG flagellin family)
MEQSIPAVMIAALIVVAGLLIAAATHSSVRIVDQSWRDIETIHEQRLGTEYTVVSTTVNPSDDVVQIVLRNAGRTTMTEPDRMDVIINYDGQDSQRRSQWLPYNAAPSANAWSITAITNDYANPGYFDPGEEMTIEIQLNPAALDNNRWLVVATDTGLAYTVYF